MSQRSSPARRFGWLLGAALPLVFVSFAMVFGDLVPYPFGTASGLVLGALLSVTMWTDSKWKKIPNWLTYPAFGWAMVFNTVGSILAKYSLSVSPEAVLCFAGQPVVGPPQIGAIGIKASLLGASACFGTMVIVSAWVRGAGGDVKLMTAVGALVGGRVGVSAICFGYMFAGLTAAAMCIWHYGPLNVLFGLQRWIGHLAMPLWFQKPNIEDAHFLRKSMPLGVYLALGAIVAMLFIPRMGS